MKDRDREGGGAKEKGVERKEAELHITKINFLVTAHDQYHVMYAYVYLERGGGEIGQE